MDTSKTVRDQKVRDQLFHITFANVAFANLFMEYSILAGCLVVFSLVSLGALSCQGATKTFVQKMQPVKFGL